MRPLYAILITLTFAIPARAQSAAELDAMEARIMARILEQDNRHNANHARVKSDIADLKVDLAEIKAGQQAIVKALGGKMQSTPTWDGQATTFNMQSSSSTMMSSGYGSAGMMAIAPRTPVRTVIRRVFRGHGSSGSASSGSGSG